MRCCYREDQKPDFFSSSSLLLVSLFVVVVVVVVVSTSYERPSPIARASCICADANSSLAINNSSNADFVICCCFDNSFAYKTFSFCVSINLAANNVWFVLVNCVGPPLKQSSTKYVAFFGKSFASGNTSKLFAPSCHLVPNIERTIYL